MSRLATAIAAGLVVALALGCNPHLTAQSAAPPGRTARLDEVNGFWTVKSYKLELSAGVAIALTCHRGGPCHELAVVSDDPSIADVRAASLGTLERSGLASQATSAAVVVVGKTPGVTRLRLRSKQGSRDIHVTVVPPPTYGSPATAAR